MTLGPIVGFRSSTCSSWEEMHEPFGKVAFELRGSTPEELRAFVKKQLEVWSRVVGEVGIKTE